MSSFLSENGLSHYDNKIKRYISTHSGGGGNIEILTTDAFYGFSKVGSQREFVTYTSRPITIGMNANGEVAKLFVMKHNDHSSTVIQVIELTKSNPSYDLIVGGNNFYTIIRVA